MFINRKHRFFHAIIGSLINLYFVLLLSQASAADIHLQRKQFIQAKAYLSQGKQADFYRLANQLHNYPLYPYLIYADLQKQLSNAKPTMVDDFLHNYANTLLAERLRANWLYVLGVQQRWNEYLHYYQPSLVKSPELECFTRLAWLNTGQKTPAFDGLKAFWLTGNDLPSDCEPLFKAWQQGGGLTENLVLERIQLGMAKKNKKLVAELTHYLPTSKHNLIALWQRIYNNPQLLMEKKSLRAYPNYVAALATACLQQLAVKDPLTAIKIWNAIQIRYSFSLSQRQVIAKNIAVGLVTSRNPQADAWFAQVNDKYIDPTARAWQIRSALMKLDWHKTNHLIEQLPSSEYSQPVWQYWRARALQQLGRTEEAEAIYRKLAGQISYYGFMACEQIKQAYPLPSKYTNMAQSELNRIASFPGLQRAFELQQLGDVNNAEQEWQWSIKQFNSLDKAGAARLAQNWKWYQRAITTANKTAKADLDLRYPLIYRDYVLFEAKRQNIAPAWIFAIIRQESAFSPMAHSRAGALGLMQLMPMTAKWVAKQVGQLITNINDLYNVNVNIRFGSHYLKHMQESYKGNVILATAAYNAGPTSVQHWLMLDHSLPADIWIETIPWHETRDYVKNVLTNTVIYEHHLRLVQTHSNRFLGVFNS